MANKAQTLYLVDSSISIDDELATLAALEGKEVLKIVVDGKKQTVFTWVDDAWMVMPLTQAMIQELNQKIQNFTGLL
jgi:hypothetical protein